MDDFQSILTQHGFTPDHYEFESTIIGFDHDLYFSLYDEDSPFDQEQSVHHRQWDNPNAYLRAELVTRDGNIAAALSYFYQRWFSEIRYDKPVLEILNLEHGEQSATIQVLLISQHNAMTLLFEIR